MKRIKEYKLTVVKAANFDIETKQVKSSTTAYEIAKQFYHEDISIYESCFVMLLDKMNNVAGYVKISQGGIAGTVVDNKLICKYAIDSLSSGVILVHNHPSGNTRPSESDKQMTSRLKSALDTLDIQLLDHLIITEDREYLSFADEGII